MKILIALSLCCCFTFNYVSAFWLFSRPTNEEPQDCIWMEWSSWSNCLEHRSIPRMQERSRTRGSIREQHGGSPCAGNSRDVETCSKDQVFVSNFWRTINAAWNSGGLKSFVDNAGSGGSSKKCVNDVLDADGNIVMSGRKCRTDRKKRDATYSIASTRKRIRRGIKPLSTKNRDVLFLIDESGSVGSSNFAKYLRLVRALTNSFGGNITIGVHKTRVGVLTFNRDQFPQMSFDEYFDKATLVNNLNARDIKYHGFPSDGATCLVKALRYTRSDMLTTARGARVDVRGTERLVILMTDGCANCGAGGDTEIQNTLNSLGQQFSRDGVPIITFLVAGESTRCFELMKGLSDGSHCYQQYWASNWAKLDEMADAIEEFPPMQAWMIGPSC